VSARIRYGEKGRFEEKQRRRHYHGRRQRGGPELLGQDDGLVEDQPEPDYVESDSFCDVRGNRISLTIFNDTHAKYRINCARDIVRLFSFAFYNFPKSTHYW
jgi:hypothetical protein